MPCSKVFVRQLAFFTLGRNMHLALIVACVSLFATTSSVTADHDERGPRNTGCSLHARGACLPSCGYAVRGRYSQKQYDRGFYAGADDGWDNGVYDGRYGRRYCERPGYRIRRYSRHYVNGYLDGYANGYDDGYRKGRQKRRPRYRNPECGW